jgi:putative transposase
MTKSVIATAVAKDVNVIFIGDITNIRHNVNFGKKTNQKFHKWPYRQVINQLKYKAQLAGIEVRDNVKEDYTSQTCCICQETPSRENTVKSNRKYRGLYMCRDCGSVINTDINGAVNISKKYLESLGIEKLVVALGRPVMYRFNGLKFVS